jgi:hypothetical protein
MVGSSAPRLDVKVSASGRINYQRARDCAFHLSVICSLQRRSEKVRLGATPKPARETRALPYMRERRRPASREYFTGLRLGSIFEMPAPFFTSMIWSRKSAPRSNSRFAEACVKSSTCISHVFQHLVDSLVRSTISNRLFVVGFC